MTCGCFCAAEVEKELEKSSEKRRPPNLPSKKTARGHSFDSAEVSGDGRSSAGQCISFGVIWSQFAFSTRQAIDIFLNKISDICRCTCTYFVGLVLKIISIDHASYIYV